MHQEKMKDKKKKKKKHKKKNDDSSDEEDEAKKKEKLKKVKIKLVEVCTFLRISLSQESAESYSCVSGTERRGAETEAGGRDDAAG